MKPSHSQLLKCNRRRGCRRSKPSQNSQKSIQSSSPWEPFGADVGKTGTTTRVSSRSPCERLQRKDELLSDYPTREFAFVLITLARPDRSTLMKSDELSHGYPEGRWEFGEQSRFQMYTTGFFESP